MWNGAFWCLLSTGQLLTRCSWANARSRPLEQGPSFFLFCENACSAFALDPCKASSPEGFHEGFCGVGEGDPILASHFSQARYRCFTATVILSLTDKERLCSLFALTCDGGEWLKRGSFNGFPAVFICYLHARVGEARHVLCCLAYFEPRRKGQKGYNELTCVMISHAAAQPVLSHVTKSRGAALGRWACVKFCIWQGAGMG